MCMKNRANNSLPLYFSQEMAYQNVMLYPLNYNIEEVKLQVYFARIVLGVNMKKYMCSVTDDGRRFPRSRRRRGRRAICS